MQKSKAPIRHAQNPTLPEPFKLTRGTVNEDRRKKMLAFLQEHKPFFEMITESTGYRFIENPTPVKGEYNWATMLDSKLILFGPDIADYLDTPRKVLGLFAHEAGHHAPPVKALHERIDEHIADSKPLLPEWYDDNVFLKYLQNCVVDVWDDTYMSRYPYKDVAACINALGAPPGLDYSYKHLTKPDQFGQLVTGEYINPSSKPLTDLVDEDVAEVYKKVSDAGLLEPFASLGQYGKFFKKKESGKRELERKFESYEKIIPYFVELVDKEVQQRSEERKKQKEEEKQKGEKGDQQKDGKGQSQKGEGQKGDEQEGDEQGEEQEGESQEGEGKQGKGKPGKGKPGKGKPGKGMPGQAPPRGPSRAAPPTRQEREEMKAMAKEVLDELLKAAEAMAPLTERGKPKEGEEGARPIEEMDHQDFYDRITDATKERLRDMGSRSRDLSERYDVRTVITDEYLRVREKRRDEISSLQSQVVEVMRENRLGELSYTQREGEISPGLEYEYISEMARGEMEPPTMMQEVKTPRFVRSELFFLVDGSGSMNGEKLRRCRELMVIMAEAHEGGKNQLEGEQLLRPDENPLKLGAAGFATKLWTAKDLDAPITEESKIVMLARLYEGAGGTEDAKALKAQYNKLTLRDPDVVKILVVLTDGYGDPNALKPLLKQMQEDDQVLALILGLGTGAEGVIPAYEGVVGRASEKSNVFAQFIPDEEFDQIIPIVSKFYSNQVRDRVIRVTEQEAR
ncbi:MAG: vWA domain-containing protein [Candidatus Altiarchaeota archaeon]